MITTNQLFEIKSICDDVEHCSDVGAFIIDIERNTITLYADKDDEFIKDSFPHIFQDLRDVGIKFEVDFRNAKDLVTPLPYNPIEAIISWGTYVANDNECGDKIPLSIEEYAYLMFLYGKIMENEDEMGC